LQEKQLKLLRLQTILLVCILVLLLAAGLYRPLKQLQGRK